MFICLFQTIWHHISFCRWDKENLKHYHHLKHWLLEVQVISKAPSTSDIGMYGGVQWLLWWQESFLNSNCSFSLFERFSYLIVLTESTHLAFWYQLNELLTPTHLHNGRLGVPVEWDAYPSLRAQAMIPAALWPGVQMWRPCKHFPGHTNPAASWRSMFPMVPPK